MAGRVPGKGFWSPKRGPGFLRTFRAVADGTPTPSTWAPLANDWQNPAPLQQPDRFWSVNLLQTTLGPPTGAALPSNDWQNPEPLRQPDRAWTQSPLTLRQAVGLPPGDQVTERPPLGIYQFYDNDLRVWTWQYNSNLIGKDQLPTGEQVTDRPPVPPFYRDWSTNLNLTTLYVPFAQRDWPLPKAPFPILQSWTLNLQQNTLRPIPSNQYDWPLPKVAPRLEQTQDVSFPLTLIGQDAMIVGDQITALPPQPTYPVDLRTVLGRIPPTVVQAPFNQFDWPVPRAPARLEQTLDVSFPLMLIGQDKLPVGDQRYELPPGAFAPTLERRGLAWSFNLNLIGQDVITVGEQVTDRPPLGPIQPLRSWTWNYLLTLIGQDRLPPGKQVTDLVPRPPFEPATRTWTWSYNLNLIGQDQLPVGDQFYTLPPVGPYYAISLRTWINPPLGPIPFNQFDWPLPQTPYFSISLRTFIASFPPELIGQDAMITGKQVTDRPQLAPIPPENVKTWIQTVNLALVTAPGTPFSQNDWPLPRRPERPERSWTGSFPLELIGQDFITAGKAITDLAPRGTSPADLRSWIWYTALAISSPSAPVGVVVTALPPLPPQPQAVGQATAFPLSLIGQDALPVGKQITDLAPRGILATDYRSWIQFTSLALNNSLGVPVGAKLFDLAPRAPFPPVNLGTWIDTTKLLLLPTPFNQTDWPTPRGPQVPQRTWTQSLNLDLFASVQPFAQYDWPVPQAPQAPQRSFTASFPLELIGKDQLPPGRQIYDRTPPGYLFSQELRTLTHSPAVPPVVVVTAGGETLLMMGVG